MSDHLRPKGGLGLKKVENRNLFVLGTKMKKISFFSPSPFNSKKKLGIICSDQHKGVRELTLRKKFYIGWK